LMKIRVLTGMKANMIAQPYRGAQVNRTAAASTRP
jgi:hypothetical protein